ncbi:MAG TPA: DUF6498-containing protein [Chitinophagaceae bacterium]|nr:DUF6498-containing protein [Chitinophagaceae bacterium]
MHKRFHLDDIGLWVLLAADIYVTLSYINDPTIFGDIILIFYMQSVLIGVFNVLDIVTVSRVYGNTGVGNLSKGCTGLFFMVHYGLFHLVYLFFLPSLVNFKNIQWHFVLLMFYILTASCLINFIQDKIRNRHEAMNIGAMFFLPYARVIPIHLTILAPKFLNVSTPVVFLILKTFADIITYVVYRRAVFKPVDNKNST